MSLTLPIIQLARISLSRDTTLNKLKKIFFDRFKDLKVDFIGWPSLLCVTLIALDQITKVMTIQATPYSPRLIKEIIPGFFNLVHYRNKGAAWGIGSSHTNILAIVSFVAFFVILFEFPKLCEKRKINFLAISMMLGGIMGNGIDRAFRPAGVVDMIEVFIPYVIKEGWYRFPAFNIADSAICVSVFIYIIASLRAPKTKTDEQKAD
ncbi:signal peptidase II [Lentisphaera profundi]|uniref:Lipoprotein signal peptidase n=1 Tax=Lentisphaera profundi TaxID=1658616 RepID=A0ABY7W016_9BACT|nr:signal peptidase II [Lentisphaera profundi]WDE98785.1 signal peptidase II [Lentisphaera profundi]